MPHPPARHFFRIPGYELKLGEKYSTHFEHLTEGSPKLTAMITTGRCWLLEAIWKWPLNVFTVTPGQYRGSVSAVGL